MSVSHDLRTHSPRSRATQRHSPTERSSITSRPAESSRPRLIAWSVWSATFCSSPGSKARLPPRSTHGRAQRSGRRHRHRPPTRGSRREVTLTTRIADTPLWADLDPDRYGQIIGNLVGNALRFADREVVVTLWSAEGGAHLSVGDDGPGIAEADLPHVFERLYVAEHSPAVQESGSGLGLAIVRDLTERMGGSVTARRSSLGGAEFVVSFAPAPPPTP